MNIYPNTTTASDHEHILTLFLRRKQQSIIPWMKRPSQITTRSLQKSLNIWHSRTIRTKYPNKNTLFFRTNTVFYNPMNEMPDQVSGFFKN